MVTDLARGLAGKRNKMMQTGKRKTETKTSISNGKDQIQEEIRGTPIKLYLNIGSLGLSRRKTAAGTVVSFPPVGYRRHAKVGN